MRAEVDRDLTGAGGAIERPKRSGRCPALAVVRVQELADRLADRARAIEVDLARPAHAVRDEPLRAATPARGSGRSCSRTSARHAAARVLRSAGRSGAVSGSRTADASSATPAHPLYRCFLGEPRRGRFLRSTLSITARGKASAASQGSTGTRPRTRGTRSWRRCTAPLQPSQETRTCTATALSPWARDHPNRPTGSAFLYGRYWARTSDSQLVELVLSQLS